MSRPRVNVAVPALALRRAEAAAALGVSLETFDHHVRPHVAVVHVGSVATYPVAELERFLSESAVADAVPSGYDGPRNGRHPGAAVTARGVAHRS